MNNTYNIVSIYLLLYFLYPFIKYAKYIEETVKHKN